MNKSKPELKEITYDKYMAAVRSGDISMNLAIITLSAIHYAEMNTQNNKITKER